MISFHRLVHYLFKSKAVMGRACKIAITFNVFLKVTQLKFFFEIVAKPHLYKRFGGEIPEVFPWNKNNIFVQIKTTL